MADTSSKHNILVTDNGSLKNVTKGATELKNTLNAAGSAAERVAAKVSKAVSPSPVQYAKAARDPGGQAGEDSGTARGVGGLTGAAGRDFAKQSQGLGGLVRLYATFAANIFAATAAFGALSRAMDTTNMVQGLNQLGAATGRNLGSLAKQVTAATDGAISLRESMEAVSKASSAGMSNKQILAMSEAAKKASQALGVNMTDAVSRLTRGISKLEPELLDELGLFTKVDKSTQDYAKSIGKSTASLTDFEKRQAFANAVLEEAKQKFSNIDIPANPYTKLLASFQNMLQVGLELINKVLSPIMEVLSTSPTALVAAMAGIGAILLKQAIPAVSGWKQGLDNAAKAARNNVIEMNKLRKIQSDERAQTVFDKSTQATKNAQDALDKLSKSTRTHAAIKTAAAFDAAKATDAQIAGLRRELVESEKVMASKLAAGAKESTVEKYEKEQALARQAISSLELRAKLEKELQALENETAKMAKKTTSERIRGYFTLDAAAQRNADKAVARSQRADIINTAVNAASTNSYIGSLREMYSAISNATKAQDAMGVRFSDGQKKMSTFNAILTGVKGTALVTASAMNTLAMSMSNVFAFIGIAVTVFQVMDSFLSTSAKESQNFKDSLDGLNSSIDNVGRTIDFINNKNPLNIISIESTQARSNAMQELSDSAIKTAESFSKLLQVRGSWDAFWDSLWDAVGKGSADKLSTSMSSTIVAAFRALEDGPAKEAGRRAIQRITNVGNIEDFAALNTELRKLDDADTARAAGDIAKALKEMSDAAAITAANLTAFKASLSEVSKQNQLMIVGLRAKDDFSKLGTDMVSAGMAMKKAFKDPMDALKALKELASDTSSLSLLPDDTALQLGTARKELEKISSELAINKKVAQEAAAEYAKLNVPRRLTEADVKQKQDVKASQEYAESQIVKYTKKLEEKVNSFRDVGNQIFAVGISNLTKGLDAAMTTAGITLSRSYLAAIKSAGGDTAKMEGGLRQEELNLQKEQIVAVYNQSKKMLDLTLTLEKSNLLEERAQLKDQAKNMGGSSRDNVYKQITKLDKAIDLLSKQKEIISGSEANAMAIAKDTKGPLYEAAQGLQNYFAELFGKQGKLAQIMAASAASALQAQIAAQGESFAQSKSGLNSNLTNIANTQANISAQQALLGIYDEQLAIENNKLSVQRIYVDYAIKLLDLLEKEKAAETIIEKIRNSGKANSAAGKEQIAAAEQARDRARAGIIENNLARQSALDAQTLQALDARLKGERQLKTTEDQRYVTATQNANALLSVEQDIVQQKISFRKQLGTIDERQAVLAEYDVALAREQLDYSNKMLGIKSAQIAQEILLYEIQEKAKAGIPVTELVAQYTAQSQALQQQLAIINNTNQAKLVSLQNTRDVGLEQARVNKELKDQETLMSKLVGVTSSLSVVFGEVGDSIGGLVTSIGAMAAAYEESGNKQKALQDQLIKDRQKYASGTEKRKEIELKAENDITQAKLDGYLAITSIAKKAFGEQSRGAQAMAKVEKAIHIAKLAMWMKEMIMGPAVAASTVATETTKAAASGTSAIAAAFAAPWPIGFVAGAAMIAIISSLLGGKAGKMPSGFDAGAQQQVQGTGQMYQDGQLVNRGGGALGDNTAKANSLNNSIDKLEAHSFATMEYSNDMLDNLKSIKKNTEGLSAMILQSGLNTQGLDINGNVITGQGTRTTDLMTRIGDILSGSQLLGYLGMGNTGIGRFLDRLNTSIWGGRSTTELQDMGIAFTGNLNNLVKSLEAGGKDIEAIYQNIKTTVSGGWFRSDRVNISTEFQALETIQAEAFGNIFKSIGDTVMSAAEALGKDSSLTASLIDSFDLVFKTSFEGLKPEEITAALEQEFSVTFNQLAERVLPEFQKFRKPGEEFGDTIVRLARDVQVSSLVLEAAGMSIGNIAGALKESESIQEATVRITESLIDLSGGLDKFVSQGQFFNENFLTEAERLAPIQKRVTDEMKRLGYATVDTREEFAQAVKALDLTTTSGQETYAGLMNVAEGFAEVYEETRASVNVLSDLKKRNAELRDTYDKLTLSSQAYHAKLTASYTEEERALYYVNKALEEFNTGISDAQKLLDDIAMSGFTTELEKIDYLRAKERATLESSSYAIFDLVTSLQRLQSGLAQARRDMETAGNTLRNAFSTALSAVNSAQSAVATGQKSAADRFAAAQSALSSAQSQAAQEAAQMASDMAQAAQEARNAMIDLSTSIKDFIKELVTSDLGLGTEENKLQNLKSQFAETLGKAKAGDKDALSAIPEVARNLLTAAQAQSSSKIDYMKTYGMVTNELSSITTAIDAANGTTKIESTGGSAGGSSSGIYEAQAEFYAARAELEKWNKDAKEAGIDINAEQKTAIETWREANAEFLELKDTLDELGIKYDDLLLKPEDTIQQAIETYRNASLQVSTFTAELSAATVALSSLIASNTAAMAAAEEAKKAIPAEPARSTAMSAANEPVVPTIPDTISNAIDPIDPNTDFNNSYNNPYKDNVYPQYASGGFFDGGLRIVGESGPELEATGPSRIWSADQTRGMLQGNASNDALIAEIKALRNEVSSLRMTAEQTEAHTRKTKDTLIRVSENGNSIRTIAA